MPMNADVPVTKNPKLNKSGVIYIIRVYLQLLMMLLSFFVAAGNLRVTRAWIYFGVVAVVDVVTSLLLIKYNPDLLNERAKERKNTKNWDKPLMGFYILIAFFGIHIVAGLDAYRFGWSALSVSCFIPGLMVYLLSVLFGAWAMIVNKHFEATARIQNDREHKVIQEGPYRIIRHPGYLSIISGMIAIPLMIGSLYAFLCSFAVIIIISIRTALEDKMLQHELNGYCDYTKKVKYRLIPFIW